MDVSVIIPVFNGADTIGEQLEALSRQDAEGVSWEIIVADNGSTDGTSQVVAEWSARLPVPCTLVDAGQRKGAAHARNVGAAAARGAIFAFWDADDWVDEQWLGQATAGAERAPVAAGLVLGPGRKPLNPEVVNGGTWRILSGNFAIRRGAYEAIGGFDGDLPPYAAEDMDFSHRIRSQGIEIGAAPEMIVRFRPSSSFDLLRKVYLNGKGEVLIQAKRAGGQVPSRLRTAAALGAWPVMAARTFRSKPPREAAKVAGRDLVRRTGHLVGRLQFRASTGEDNLALWVSPVSNLAGVARHMIDAVRVGVPGWQIVVAAPEGPLLDEIRALGGHVEPIEIGEGVSVPEAVAALRAAVKKLKPAVVHSHLARADILSTMATVGLPVSLVSTEHHISPDRLMFHSNELKATVMETVHRVRLKRFAALIAVSDSTARDMRRFWHAKMPITVVRNGVDRPPGTPTRTPGLRFLSLTRLSPEKNLDATLRAFASIRASHPDARLTVGGTGSEGERLKEMAFSLGVEEAVDFPGFVDADQAMSDHDVLLQPSKSDNLSYTLLDAVAQGMGVAASSIGGNPEILPAHCLADDVERLAEVAVEQALNVELRPVLPASIPTVSEMTEQIAAVYATLGARR